MRKERTSANGGAGAGSGGGIAVTNMGLNLLLLVFMVATNILSLYHLSSTHRLSLSPPPPLPLSSSADEHLLLLQLHTIRATISHLQSQSQSPSKSKPHSSPPPAELLLFSRLSPVSSACAAHPTLLRQYMNYTPFSPCPLSSSSLAESLILRGCHPLPRRRCFSASPPKPTTLSLSTPTSNFMTTKSALDLSIPQLLRLAQSSGSSPIRLALDIAGGDASLASALRRASNTTVLTTTLNFNQPFSQIAASRGSITLHSPLQSRFPIQDSLLDLVRAGHAVNRWIPAEQLEFMVYDVDRVLRPGGLFWVDHFFCKKTNLDPVYKPVLDRLGYKVLKWAVGEKTDREVYLTALLQKPFV
ncbi:hypothetical protein LUZ60_014231 [Juncus effusus]|nr:hypothetical protein LUZ60_014231 [Juncus effusus]